MSRWMVPVTAVAVGVATFCFWVAAPAASKPSVHSVIEGRDAAASRPVLFVYGDALNKLRSFALAPVGGGASRTDITILARSSGQIVLQLPTDVVGGKYELTGIDSKGLGTNFTVGLSDAAPLPGSVGVAALDPALISDLNDAQTLTGRTSADFDSRNDTLYATRAFVGAKVFLTSVVNLNFSLGVIAWDAEAFDTDGFHSSVNADRMTCSRAGYYRMQAKIVFVQYPGAPTLTFKRNGSVVDQTVTTFTSNSADGVMYSDMVLPLVVGDYVEVVVSNTGVQAKEGQVNSWFQIYKLGE